jgi:hypothetical protein
MHSGELTDHLVVLFGAGVKTAAALVYRVPQAMPEDTPSLY